MIKHTLSIALFIITTISAVLGGYQLFKQGLSLQTDLLGLVPDSTQSITAKTASKRLNDTYGNAFIMMLSGKDPQQLNEASKWIEQQLDQNQHIRLTNNQNNIDQQLQYFQSLKPYRFHFLTPLQKTHLLNNDLPMILNDAWLSLYSPGTMSNVADIIEDPLNIFNHYLEQHYDNTFSNEESDNREFEILEHRLVVRADHEPQRVFTVISGSVMSGAFNLDAQESLSASTRKITEHLAVYYPDLQFYRAGAVFHGAEAAALAKQEINIIAIGSGIGVVLIFLLCFQSIRPLLMSLCSIAYGTGCALVFCQWYFETFHLLTLVFGASLIGVAIDYALHYLTRATQTKQRSQVLKHMLPSLAMGLATSLIGYSSLLQAPLPGLQQMAIFSMVGLSCAWLFVIVVFPCCNFFSHRSSARLLTVLASLPEAGWNRLSSAQILLIITLLSTLAMMSVFKQFDLSTDLRVLHTPNQQLITQQKTIAEVLPSHSPNQFFLIEANNTENLLQSAENFSPVLERLQQAGAITGYQLISDYLPSIVRQASNLKLLSNTVYQRNASADQFMQAAGFDSDAINDFHYQLGTHSEPLRPKHWLEVAPADKQLLWLGQSGNTFSSVVLLHGVSDLQKLHQSAINQPNIRFIDTVSNISDTLTSKRESATRLLVLAYGAIVVLLVVRYRQTQALTLACIPLLSSLFTLAILSTFGIAINLFHVFALYLILGLGMDYSIFSFESNKAPSKPNALNHKKHCQLAIVLSMLTSSLSFGLLSFSSTPMISAFGITVMLGSLLNWILLPLIERKIAA